MGFHEPDPPAPRRSGSPAPPRRRKRPLRTSPALLAWVLVIDAVVLCTAWLGFHTSPVLTGVLHLALLSALAFLLFGADKWSARRQKARVSELNLLGVAALGGAAGALAGMGVFRHKTRRALFTITVLLFLFVHLVALALLAMPAESP